MLTTYTSLKNYFEQIATEHLAINDYVFGGSTRIIARRNSIIKYPVLWLATPDVVKRPGERQQFACLVMILTGVRDDFDEEDVANEEMKTIADDIYLRLKHDAAQGLFDFGTTDTVMQPKFRQGSDNDTGWAIDCDITLGDDACYNPTKFGQ